MTDPVRVQKWRMQGREIVILLTGEPDMRAAHRAMRAFTLDLAVSESTDGPESPGLTQKDPQ